MTTHPAITYPLMLNLQGRRVLVVGGGRVGLHKARSLARAGAAVTLVSGRAGRAGPAGTAEPCDAPNLAVVAEDYRRSFVEGALLVIACTDDPATNRRVADDARRAGALVNVADSAELCDFFLPAIARDGSVVLAVGTGGASPALAAGLRDSLAGSLPAEVGRFAAVLAAVRRTVAERVACPTRRRAIMKRLAGTETWELLRQNGETAVIELADKLVSGPEP